MRDRAITTPVVRCPRADQPDRLAHRGAGRDHVVEDQHLAAAARRSACRPAVVLACGWNAKGRSTPSPASWIAVPATSGMPFVGRAEQHVAGDACGADGARVVAAQLAETRPSPNRPALKKYGELRPALVTNAPKRSTPLGHARAMKSRLKSTAWLPGSETGTADVTHHHPEPQRHPLGLHQGPDRLAARAAGRLLRAGTGAGRRAPEMRAPAGMQGWFHAAEKKATAASASTAGTRRTASSRASASPRSTPRAASCSSTSASSVVLLYLPSGSPARRSASRSS